MNLEILTEDDLLYLKGNISPILCNFSNSDNRWLTDFFGRSPLQASKYTIDAFELDMSKDRPFLTETENVKRVYTHLRFLSDSEASEERLWAGLCLGRFWNYTRYRWDHRTESNVLQHFFFGYSARRSLTRNALARLWWIGRLTYDSKRNNPFELTEFVCENSNYISDVLERNTSNNPEIISAFLAAIIDSRKNGTLINRGVVGELSKYLNLLGGVYILDCVSYDFIYEKITLRIAELLESKFFEEE